VHCDSLALGKDLEPPLGFLGQLDGEGGHGLGSFASVKGGLAQHKYYHGNTSIDGFCPPESKHGLDGLSGRHRQHRKQLGLAPSGLSGVKRPQ